VTEQAEAKIDAATLDRMLGKIRKMLARADHPNTPEDEAKTSRRMAEEMMAKYRIDESMAVQSGLHAIVPVSREMPVCPASSPYAREYLTIAAMILRHAGCRGAWSSKFIDGDYTAVFTGYGYDSDLRFAEMLYQSARIAFAARMEPTRDPGLSDEDNVYNMRQAGMERIKIAHAMGWAKASRVTGLYVKACAARGEEPILIGKGTDNKTYREQYATGFTNELYMRLNAARNGVNTGGAELVLAGRKEAVDEAYYADNPWARPAADTGSQEVVELSAKEQRALERELARQQAERRKRVAKANSATGRAALGRGRDAARTVDLGGTSAKVKIDS
jgi:hypothetical protein